MRPREGRRELRLPSPSSLAGPLGSPVRALRVGSGRGPTLRTARRGAGSAWTRHATGLADSSRSVHPDQRTPEPLVRRRSPRNFRSNSPHRAWSRRSPDPSPVRRGQFTPSLNPRKRRSFFGLDHVAWSGCGELNAAKPPVSRTYPPGVELWATLVNIECTNCLTRPSIPQSEIHR